MAKRAPKKTAADLTAGARMVILHGPEAFLRAAHLDQLRTRCEEVHDAVDVVRFDGSFTPVADILDECRSAGLLASHKLVVVDEVDQLLKKSTDARTDARTLLERYAEAPADTATLVLRADRKITGNLATKHVPKVGVVIDCAEVNDAQAVSLLIGAATDRGSAIDRPAAALLVERLGTDLARLRSELEKLIAAAEAGGKDAVDRPLVEQMVAVTREDDPWAIQGPLLSGRADAALTALSEQLDVSRTPTPLVRFFIYDLARKLHSLSAGLDAGQDERSLAKELKLFGPAASRVTSVARSAPTRRLAQLVRECADADHRLKTGRADDRRQLEDLALRFASLSA